MFASDVVLLGIGYRFFFGKREGKGFWDILVPILVLIAKFGILGFGVYWAVAVFRVQVAAFVFGAGFVLLGGSLAVFLRPFIKR